MSLGSKMLCGIVLLLSAAAPAIAIANETAPTCFAPGQCVVARNFWNGPVINSSYIPVYGTTLFGINPSTVTYCGATSSIHRNAGQVATANSNCLEQIRSNNPFTQVAFPLGELYRATCGNPTELRTRITIRFSNGRVYNSPLLRSTVSPCVST